LSTASWNNSATLGRVPFLGSVLEAEVLRLRDLGSAVSGDDDGGDARSAGALVGSGLCRNTADVTPAERPGVAVTVGHQDIGL